MSGNVGEWTSECYSNDYYYYCGGKYDNDLSNITVNSVTYGYSIYNGVRLILTFPQPATGDKEEE